MLWLDGSSSLALFLSYCSVEMMLIVVKAEGETLFAAHPPSARGCRAASARAAEGPWCRASSLRTFPLINQSQSSYSASSLSDRAQVQPCASLPLPTGEVRICLPLGLFWKICLLSRWHRKPGCAFSSTNWIMQPLVVKLFTLAILHSLIQINGI